MQTILTLISIIMTLTVILTIVFFILFFVNIKKVKIKEKTTKAYENLNIHKKVRYNLSTQLMEAITNNQNNETLIKLLNEYLLIKNEQEEIKWEEEWIPQMKSFLAKTKENINCPQEIKQLIQHFEENEIQLSKSHNELANLLKRKEKLFNKQPWKMISKISEYLIKIIDKFNTITKK